MLFRQTLLAMATVCCLAVPTLCEKAPTLKHAFTAHITLETPLGPIPADGQLTIVEPITGGSIEGPAFSGTIANGGASVINFNTTFTLAQPFVQIWGTTDDGEACYVQATGIGKQGSQLARVIVSTSGKYAALENEFILATFTDNDEDPPTFSTVDGWIASRD